MSDKNEDSEIKKSIQDMYSQMRKYIERVVGTPQEQMDRYGITLDQMTNIPEISLDPLQNLYNYAIKPSSEVIDAVINSSSKRELLENMAQTQIGQGLAAQGLAPRGLRDGYPQPKNVIADILSNSGLKERMRMQMDNIYEAAEQNPALLRQYENSVRLMDYYNLYNGYPQHFNTLSISDWKPEKSGNSLDFMQYCYKDNNISATLKNNLPQILKNCKERLENKTLDISVGDEKKVDGFATDILAESLYAQKYNSTGKDLYDKLNEQELNSVGDQLGHYHLKIGRDERGCYISYYDHWDMSIGEAMGQTNGQQTSDWGKPMDIYDRIYFDPNTLQALNVRTPVQDTMVADKQKAYTLMDAVRMVNQTVSKIQTAQNKPQSNMLASVMRSKNNKEL